MVRGPIWSAAVVFLLGLNLRPAVTSLGSALPDIATAPGVTGAVAAVLVALPLWVCGIGGLLTPWLQAATGTQRTVQVALVLLAVAQVIRVAGGSVLLVAGTVLVCVAIALIATMLPLLVGGKSTAFSVCYTLSLGCGSTAGALITPWIVSESSWRFGLAGWAVLAAITVPFSRGLGGNRPSRGALSPFAVSKSGPAWGLTVYFGLVSTVTFLVMGWLPAILRDAGVSADVAGACLSLAMILGLPMMWLVPWWVHKRHNQHALLALLVLPSMVSVVGLLVAPAVMPWLWATGLGIGMGGIALALTSIPRRAGADPQITTALSAMVQGGGYLIAGVGALACGLVHTITQSWQVSLVMVLAVLCGQACAGLIVVRPGVVRSAAVPQQRTAAWPDRVPHLSANEPCPPR
ncbi:MFS transporter [Kibdelosporangium aridum]|uniref:MFS transporter n=1 Tax=Kibdelosporangium aridum TaxID=2030 RepID=A0A428YZY8_KIBAR|nr:MFS transporter [Kibdelosporangium aridum]RSM77330.1 MFS transporter [Kibdelosporangium aridum]